MSVTEAEVVLKIVHTADWHLGKRFRGFDDEDDKRLSRERLAVVERLLHLANQQAAQAVLCAGDLFDSPEPGAEWWGGLAKLLQQACRPTCPVVLLPGNHDPLKTGSVWSVEHPFRRALPAGVHVVDRDDFSLPLGDDAVVLAVPCRSQAGQEDPTQRLPPRLVGDERIRIGLVHGQTFDIEGHRANFPISKSAAMERGLDYLAVGDTHAFREVDTGTSVPVVYPGAPEPMRFGETEAGSVAVVFFPPRPRRPIVKPYRVGRYQWLETHCRSVQDLRVLLERQGLGSVVLRLILDLDVTLEEQAEVERLRASLRGTAAQSGRVAALQVDVRRLDVDPAGFDRAARLPPVLRACVERLQVLAQGPGASGLTARRALAHLYRTTRSELAPEQREQA